LPSPDRKRLVLLTGARQTGKTTLAKALYPNLRYINPDAPENREAVQNMASAAWGWDIGAAVLDEAQKEPVVFEKVKYAYDAGDISFTVLLGSSQIFMLKKLRETLALAGIVYFYRTRSGLAALRWTCFWKPHTASSAWKSSPARTLRKMIRWD